MPRRCVLLLSDEQQTELVQLRDHAAKPYLRERAAVLLAIAQRQSIRRAAQSAGLKPHDADTVCVWVARYRRDGVAGLRIRTGRGRKPACFPAHTGAGADGVADGGRATAGALRPGTQPLVARRPAPRRPLVG